MGLSGIALVTGGAGFVGSHIAAALSASGARVRIIDDLSTGYLENVEEVGGDVDFVRASVADEPVLRKALEDVELVFHEAAIPSVPRSVENPRQTHIASVDSTFSLLTRGKGPKSPPRCLRSLEFGLRRSANASQSGGHAARPTVTLRSRQTRR